MLYSYPFVAHTALASHVIEPTAQIIVRPNRIDQRRLPDEDAKSLVFDDTLLFDIDKFSGYDRFETGTRANVGLQYTFQANNGFYARAVFGQSYPSRWRERVRRSGLRSGEHGAEPTLNFSPASGLETNRSDYVAGLYLSPVTGLSLIAQSRFDERDWSLRRQDTIAARHLRAAVHVGRLLVLAVRSDHRRARQAGGHPGRLGLRLTDNWSVAGMMRYDIDAKDRIQDQIQLKYSDECFVLTASYTETFVENTALDLRPDRTLMLRFELKHLGEYSYKTDQLDHVFGDTNAVAARTESARSCGKPSGPCATPLTVPPRPNRARNRVPCASPRLSCG